MSNIQTSDGPEWQITPGLTGYDSAVEIMNQRMADVIAGHAQELIWLLEHPPLYTAGLSAKAADLKDPNRFPIHKTGRGGQYTYHGPGQRVIYLVLDLRWRGRDLRKFVATLENWIIAALAELSVSGTRLEGKVGVWVSQSDTSTSHPHKYERRRGRDQNPSEYHKIAAIGVRVRKWVSSHGVSINIAPDLGHYTGIVPCGISDHGVTSLKALGAPHRMEDIDSVLRSTCPFIMSRFNDGAALL